MATTRATERHDNTQSRSNNLRGTQNKGSKKRGFAAMPKEQVREIASKGGQARAEQLGPAGYKELGKAGGQARAEQLGRSGYQKLGAMGGHARGRHSQTDKGNK